MRRNVLLVALGALAVAFAAVALRLAARPPAGPAKAEEGKSEAPVRLPLARVVLYSSGVGYFQREGAVEGSARLDLSFPAADVNDLLKSMVLRDRDGGQVAAVSYDSSAPLERTLRSFAVDLTNNPPLFDILNQARGQRVEVSLATAPAGSAATLSGAVVGLEKQKQPAGKDQVVEASVLNLWCADGLRAVRLADVQRLRFQDPALDAEFKKALGALAQSRDAQKKGVSIRFDGEGRRRVSVGYVVEHPVWKTSYRLVLGAKEGQKPYLQGWAVVDNPSDEDWRDVRMALVSGRPISFKMDLYTPLYAPRPTVVPDLFASLVPPQYSGALIAEGEKGTRQAKLLREQARQAGTDTRRRLLQEDIDFERMRPKAPDKKESAPGAAGGSSPSGGERLRKELEERMELGRSVAAAATASKLGDFFQYLIEKPVTLPRQKSALLPVVGKDMRAQRVSVYNEAVQPKFPLLGLRFRNATGLHLMQGPVTVFEGGRYAGDARLPDLQPREERLVSYAVDLGTEVSPARDPDSGRLVRVKAARGVLSTATKVRESKTYTARNRNERERTLLIEHPVRHDFKLVETPNPAETARDVYRFELKVPAGANKALTVTEEKEVASSVTLASSNDDQLRHFLSQPVTSEKVKAGLRKALELRGALARTQREVAELERQLKVITEDQARLRANLKETPPTAKAHQRYLDKLDRQETQIEELQGQLKKLQAVEHQRKKELDDFLDSFSAE
jgi:hypothetical protein